MEHGRKAGVSDIEKGFTSPQNSHLVLHDSQGFCHGSSDNFNVVKKFIETRNQMTNLKDRLHAIWFDLFFGSLYCAIDSVWSGCVPKYPHTAEVYSKFVRRRFSR